MKILHSISIKKIIVIYLLLCPITVLFSQNNKKEKDVISKREKEIQKYNQLLSDFKSGKNPDTNITLIKTEGVKYTKHFCGITGIANIEFVKPTQLTLGFAVSGGYRLFSKTKYKEGSSSLNPKIIEREIFIKPTLGYIYRKRYNTSVFFIPEIAYRHTFALGIFTEVGADIGYQYSKLNAPVYEQQSNGTFKKVRFGFHNLIVGGKISAGYDFSKKFDSPLAVHFGTGLLYRYPNNKQWSRNILVEFGLSYVFRREKE